MKKLSTIAIMALLLLGAGVALAANDSHLELKAVAEIEVEVVNAAGEKEIRRVEAGKVVPGDKVIYTIYYVNVGQEPAADVSITNPVPEHMEVSDVQVDGLARVLMSVDGGQQFDAPENLKVLQDDGSERPAQPGEYTHIRWNLPHPVQPGEKGNVSFNAKLL